MSHFRCGGQLFDAHSHARIDLAKRAQKRLGTNIVPLARLRWLLLLLHRLRLCHLRPSCKYSLPSAQSGMGQNASSHITSGTFHGWQTISRLMIYNLQKTRYTRYLVEHQPDNPPTLVPPRFQWNKRWCRHLDENFQGTAERRRVSCNQTAREEMLRVCCGFVAIFVAPYLVDGQPCSGCCPFFEIIHYNELWPSQCQAWIPNGLSRSDG